jgi:hypothetical protein
MTTIWQVAAQPFESTMAFRLDDLIIAGFFCHSRQFSFHGRILLRGCEDPILVELTGDPAEDLRGRMFEFEVPRNDRPPTDEDRKRARAFNNQQIGPVGEITAARKQKTLDVPVEEIHHRLEPGDTPSVQERHCLYLEWFSQNGRVVIDLADLEMKFFEKGEEPGGTDDFPPLEDDLESGEPFDAVGAQPDEEIDPFTMPDVADGESAIEEDQGYGLIPDELNREMERSARRTDREIAGEPEDAIKAIEECEMLDDLIDHAEGTRTGKLIERLKLPPPAADLTDLQAGEAMGVALKELALFGVAFHICEHCSIQEAYRMLIEEVCEECKVFPEMRGTSFVQHFSTSDFCQQCQS